MVPTEQAVRDARTTESRLRDSRTESGREWPGNRLYGVCEKCIRHKPRERGKNLTPCDTPRYRTEIARVFVYPETASVCRDCMVERNGFEPEISVAVLPSTQSETLVPRIGTLTLTPETRENVSQSRRAIAASLSVGNCADISFGQSQFWWTRRPATGFGSSSRACRRRRRSRTASTSR